MLKRLGIKRVLYAISTIALVGCDTTLPVTPIEKEVQSELTQHGRLSISSITCPTTVKPEPGKSFECVGELDTGGTFFVTVTQENDRGKVRWEVPSSWSLLNLNQLSAEFEQKLKAQSQATLTVQCGGLYRPTKPGDSFECQLVQRATSKQAPRSTTILVRVEPEGNVTWQEVRIVAATPNQTTPATTPATSDSASTASPSSQTVVSPSNLSPQVGAKDATGWTQLED